MRIHISHLGAAVLMGTLAAACGKPTDAGQETIARAADEAGGRQTVKLTGCVQAGPGDQWRLQNIVVVPPSETFEETVTASLERRPGIVEGSWVWLQPGPRQDLGAYLGKEVSVIAKIVQDGTSTIATSGRTKEQTLAASQPESSSSTDRANPPATIPPPVANANGTGATLAIAKINTIAETCGIEQEEARIGITGMKGRRAPKEDHPAAGSHR